MSEKVTRKCAACHAELRVSDMKACMHAQSCYYVCNSGCMRDFYKQLSQPNAHQRLKAECEKLRGDHWQDKAADIEQDRNKWREHAETLEAECERLRSELAVIKEQLPNWIIPSAKSLLALDEKGVLVPHGIGGHARDIIEAFIIFHDHEANRAENKP